MIDKRALIDGFNRVMQKLFGLQPGWHRELDIVKNNYALASRYMAQGNYRDAVFRLKFLVWLDPKHKAGLLDLARAYKALGDKAAAGRALAKLLALEPAHPEGLKLKAALASNKNDAADSAVEIAQEMDAKPLYQVHKACFPLFWKEQEISDMLMASGTRAWCAIANGPVGMLITRAQFEQAEILTIAVVPDARKTGVARRMMAAAEKELAAAGVRKIFLEVAENNKSAYALYLKIGYGEMSRRKGYYKQMDGSVVDALVMAKDLQRRPSALPQT
ncbi:MAG: GNAT family N-acetyltransferase [Alphaproteobacteria bacterium]|nr:GNAT family N-acetyltransferase [Alphaproteobacteria bacterium]